MSTATVAEPTTSTAAATANPFAYCELHTDDPARSREFYSALFAWTCTTQQTPMGEYTEIDTREGFPAGLMLRQPGEAFAHWLPYVRVADLEAARTRARELGATVGDVGQVPDVGSFCSLVDPMGVPLGLWQPLAR